MDQHTGPQGLGSRIAMFREAARTVWGDAVVDATLAELDAESRAAFAPDAVVSEWMPQHIYVAFIDAIWRIACGGHGDDAYRRWVDVITDRGFGHAREIFTSLASPILLLRRAQELWRFEHSSGTLTLTPLGPHRARLTLRDHPFVETEATRFAIAEAFRYVIQLTGAREVTVSHELAGDVLHVVLAWQDPDPA